MPKDVRRGFITFKMFLHHQKINIFTPLSKNARYTKAKHIARSPGNRFHQPQQPRKKTKFTDIMCVGHRGAVYYALLIPKGIITAIAFDLNSRNGAMR